MVTIEKDLADLGPFFAVDTHRRGEIRDSPWESFSDLLTDTALDARVCRVRSALAAGTDSGQVEERVAASVAHLGLVARVVAPQIASIALRHRPMSWRAEDLWWQDQLGGPYALSVVFVDERDPWAGSAVVAVTAAFSRRFAVSRHVLAGNVASAANSAARLVAAARPELSAGAHAAADEILAEPDVESGSLRSGPEFRRRSCCLIYRVTGDRTAVCGDCVLQ